ncbi:MAG TPA: hypothetical protein VEB22_04245, partial [Phycisphaerales bacterium]|nr:hypothetical protein [Phycisphaerales bacterium]
MNRDKLKLFVAAGLVGSAASVSFAQPYVLNITGATLLENYVIAPASTNDYIDVDGNGTSGRLGNGIQQLAPAVSGAGAPVFAAGTHWLVQYRNIGSIAGLNELVRTGRTWITSDWTDLNGIPGTNNTTTKAFYNRTQFINNNALVAGTFGDTANPGAFAWRSPMVADGQPRTAVFGHIAGQGLHADIAVCDVPALWGLIAPGGAPDFNRTPGLGGYGDNPRTAVAPDGTTPSGNISAKMVNASTVNLFNPANPGAANADTLFDNPLAFAPVGTFTNIGTGIQQIEQSNIRHLLATGRLVSGENLTIVTRDAGSGTRNGHNNSVGLDPSWGVGENVGAENSNTPAELVGDAYLPSNKTGSSNVERTLRNTRLGIGYTGAERFVNSGLNGANYRLELLAVRNDLVGGTAYSRPTVTTVFDNGPDGWIIGGPASLITFGDPKAEPVSAGGQGLTTPRMRNPQAATYLNNFRQSVDNFSSVPNDPANVGMPGEYAATQFVLLAGIDRLQDQSNPLNLVPNPALNQTLQDTLKSISVYANAAFQSFNTAENGRVPERRQATTGFAGSYSDNRNATYVNQAGVNVSYGTQVTARNKIAGDFDNDGLRNVNDAAGMIAAWRDRAGLGSWDGVGTNGGASDTSAVIEMLGDFNNDGNFDSKDVRYFADG